MTTKAEIDAMKFALAQRANKGVAHMEGGGQARTRAGTIAQPTFIDEQLAKTSERLSKLYNDPNQAMKDIARQYFPSSADTPEEQQRKLEDLALGFAGNIKTPKAPKPPASTGGDYMPGVHYHDPLQPAEMTFSEALGNAGAEGKTLNFTEADRSRVFGSNRGGVGFSGLQHYSEPHAEAGTSWGFGNKLTAEKKIRQNDPEKTIWTTFVGAPTQHRSNTVVLQDAINEFHNAVSQNKVHPAQIDLINARIRSAKDPKTKALLFDKSFDLTDPNALSEATTFSRRSAIGDALLGEGVKGAMRKKGFKEAHGNQPWVDAGKMESILQRETDPDLVNAGTYDVGNRLFTMSGDIVQRPDLNFAFPWQTTGIDLGFKYIPTRKELAMRDWLKQYEGRLNKSGKPAPVSYMDLARNNPSQFVSEDFLNFLRKHGFKDGGAVHMATGGAAFNTDPDMSDGGQINPAMQYFKQGGSPDPYQDDEDMSQDEKNFALLKEQQKKAVIKPMTASSTSLNELRQSLGLPDQDIEYRDTGLGGALQLNTYSKERAKEMFPKQYGIDDQRDAARHMIAAGTLARKLSPSVARFVGKGYEFLSSPATAIGYGLGLNEMPPDYAMDIYNNELGIELARKAKTQEEFERLVNMSATGALPEKSPGRAMIIPTKKK